jgi:thiamine biosynthesis lipoprotein
MATVFEVRCGHPDAAYAGQAAHAAFGLVDRLEQALSRFVPNSDVARINALRSGEAVRVDAETLECLAVARHMFDLTRGAFDVSRGTGLPGLDLFPDDGRVVARAEGIRLDLGGIGKGYAVDLMADLLREWGIDRALVHGGFSSVLALGPPPGREGWPLTLSAPWPGHEEVLTRIEARGLALSASGTKKGDHIVDPTTGRAAERRAVWVAVAGDPGTSERAAAPTFGPRPSAVAEGLSTAFMVLPLETVASLARQWPEVEAWIARGPEGEGAEHPGLLHLGRLLA